MDLTLNATPLLVPVKINLDPTLDAVTTVDCVFITVHVTDKTTPEEVEEDVIAKDFNDKDISLDDVEKLSKVLDLDIQLIINKEKE